jgi:predicted RNase H-like nuclease
MEVRMIRFAGVDGCRDGWLVASVTQDLTQVVLDVYEDFASIVASDFGVIAIDIPIGLPDSGARLCDQQARQVIGPRRSSVFPCPIRSTLEAPSYSEACSVGRRIDGRGLSQQAWAIAPKISEVDAHMSPELQDRIIEVHPEVCFWALNGEQPLQHHKKTADGIAMRRSLLAARGFDVTLLNARPPRGAAIDDVNDALAALLTAIEFQRGQAKRLPDSPTKDSRSLRMEMWYQPAEKATTTKTRP